MLTTGSIPPKRVSKAVDLLEYAPTSMSELTEWIVGLELHQAIAGGMLAITDCVTRPFHVTHLQAALFALEARWAEAGPKLQAREPFPLAPVDEPDEKTLRPYEEPKPETVAQRARRKFELSLARQAKKAQTNQPPSSADPTQDASGRLGISPTEEPAA